MLAALLFGGCSTAPGIPPAPPVPPVPPPAAAADAEDCAGWFARLDAVVAAAGTVDGQSARLDGFAQLRASRFLVAVKPGVDDAGFEAWAERLRRLDAVAREVELGNAGQPVDRHAIERCGRVLLARDTADPARREALARAATVADDYSLGARIAGLYPLTSAPFSVGVHRLHVQTAERFAEAARRGAPPASGGRYVPPPAVPLAPAEVAALIARSSDNPLGIPEPGGEDLARLHATFAPTLVTGSDAQHDRLGTPTLAADGVTVDTAQPRLYTLATHTRFAGETLLQLVYVAWFTERPRSGPLDLLGGHLDGIVWRVTLGRDGRPLLYDVIHACGCYHMAFPGPRLRVRDDPPRWQEPLLVPAPAPVATTGLTLGLQAATHYLESVSAPPRPGTPRPGTASVYRLAGYDELRALPLPGGGTRSLFRADGIVAGSERAERWLFWPMGVPEPGAMRQWGRHAVAFVGRRHFDDADLIDAWFAPAR